MAGTARPQGSYGGRGAEQGNDLELLVNLPLEENASSRMSGALRFGPAVSEGRGREAGGAEPRGEPAGAGREP